MKTILILGTLLTAPAFAGGGSASGSSTSDTQDYPPGAHRRIPASSSDQGQDVATLLARRKALMDQLSNVEAENAELETQIREKGEEPQEDTSTSILTSTSMFSEADRFQDTGMAARNTTDAPPTEEDLNSLQCLIHRGLQRGSKLTEQLLTIARTRQARLQRNIHRESAKAVDKAGKELHRAERHVKKTVEKLLGKKKKKKKKFKL